MPSQQPYAKGQTTKNAIKHLVWRVCGLQPPSAMVSENQRKTTPLVWQYVESS